MVKIYHNANCKKSREGLQLLKDNNIEFEIIYYLKDRPFSFDSLKTIIKKTGKKPEDLIRKLEAEYKTYIKGKSLTDDEMINLMVKFPKIIQRPIVEINNLARLIDSTFKIDDLTKQ